MFFSYNRLFKTRVTSDEDVILIITTDRGFPSLLHVKDKEKSIFIFLLVMSYFLSFLLIRIWVYMILVSSNEVCSYEV